jgi:DNA-binding transcriptional MerR regulator
MAKREEWTLADLAEDTGLTARTIRYYIARGLVSGPVTAGRGAVYTADHVRRLREIRDMQSQGATLAEIAAPPATLLPRPVEWQEFAVSGDVVVRVKGGTSGWKARQIRSALEQFAARILAISEEERNERTGDGNLV